jgi:FKBP-type peptidyl-prolyl cis-trans isomerase FklB
MRALVIAVLCLLLFNGPAVAEEKKQMSEKEKLSYSLGYMQGNSMANFFKERSVEIDANTLSKAFKAGFSGSKPALTQHEMHEIVSAYQVNMAAKQSELIKEAAEKNKKAGEAFLQENRNKEGIVTLPSGLQYKVLKEGTGETPKATNRVKVNYRGTLIDGREFDNSYKRGEPAVFEAEKVIPGWTEALQLMKVGAKWEVFIPANLAYGDKAGGAIIGPNSVLIFEIELLAIEK